ncbi:MAG: short-chain fatty acid transporter [Halobacteriovoraceae bacterium]|nr:short-chain fatty acid transporter [Halobacteriovoraceae bacterium]
MQYIARLFTSVARRYLPDAYVFAIILTLVVFLFGWFFMGEDPIKMAVYWGDGFWNLLKFGMQMAMILVTGFTLAKAPLVKKFLLSIAKLPKNNVQAVGLVTICACVASYLNWGFGLVVSALLAMEVAKKLRRVNYGLLIASAYSGFLVWHGGLSGSIPLKLTDPQGPIQKIISREFIGVNETLYAGFNILLLVVTVSLLTFINCWMAKDEKGLREVSLEHHDVEPIQAYEESPATKLENSLLLSILIGVLFLIYIVNHFASGGGPSLNMMITIFLFLAIALHYRPSSLLNAFNESVKGSSGILLQFPFYAGIMGMMSGSGLAMEMSEIILSFATSDTLLFFSYLSAGIVNFFVPSGGGQWALQGPVILPVAAELGVDFAKASMAIAWGDAWTNMVQPFWALPVLAAGKCSLREMMGYCSVIFIVIGTAQSIIFLLI